MRCFSLIFSSEFSSEISLNHKHIFEKQKTRESIDFLDLLLIVRPIGISSAEADSDIASGYQHLECSRAVKRMLRIKVLFSTVPSASLSEPLTKLE